MDFPASSPESAHPMAALRRFARPRNPAVERCEMCAAELAAEHPHLLELERRQIMCACDACATLFTNDTRKHRRIPRDIFRWTDFAMTDAQWAGLGAPISLAFFLRSSRDGQVAGIFPSPAGPTEAPLPDEAWQGLIDANPRLAELAPDVEALLVNRTGGARQYFRAPIDHCYKLVGLVRLNWRGLSGGTEVWKHITSFFDDLNRRAIEMPIPSEHA